MDADSIPAASNGWKRSADLLEQADELAQIGQLLEVGLADRGALRARAPRPGGWRRTGQAGSHDMPPAGLAPWGSAAYP